MKILEKIKNRFNPNTDWDIIQEFRKDFDNELSNRIGILADYFIKIEQRKVKLKRIKDNLNARK